MLNKNLISIGYQCYNAQCLSWLGLRKESLPFDYLKSPLPKVYNILSSLKDPNFNLNSFLDKFLISDKYGWNPPYWPDNKVAIYNSFYLGHFIKHREQQFLPTTEVREAFHRRMERLADQFYNQHNTLIYNDFEIKNDKTAGEYIQYIPKILELNPNNEAFLLLHKNRPFDVGDKNITYCYIDVDIKSPNYTHEVRGKMMDTFKQLFIDQQTQ